MKANTRILVGLIFALLLGIACSSLRVPPKSNVTPLPSVTFQMPIEPSPTVTHLGETVSIGFNEGIGFVYHCPDTEVSAGPAYVDYVFNLGTHEDGVLILNSVGGVVYRIRSDILTEVNCPNGTVTVAVARITEIGFDGSLTIFKYKEPYAVDSTISVTKFKSSEGIYMIYARKGYLNLVWACNPDGSGIVHVDVSLTEFSPDGATFNNVEGIVKEGEEFVVDVPCTPPVTFKAGRVDELKFLAPGYQYVKILLYLK